MSTPRSIVAEENRCSLPGCTRRTATIARIGLNWEDHAEVEQRYIRPTEVDALIGDPSKATKELNREAKTRWKELAELMVDADMAAFEN